MQEILNCNIYINIFKTQFCKLRTLSATNDTANEKLVFYNTLVRQDSLVYMYDMIDRNIGHSMKFCALV